MEFLIELKRRFNQFMRGRYGHDQLNTVILIFYLIFLLVADFVRSDQATHTFNLLSLFTMLLFLLRSFSKNIHQRSKENDQFIKLRDQLMTKTTKPQTTKIFRCPNCSQKVRVPKGRGKIEITCPKCGHHFDKRS